MPLATPNHGRSATTPPLRTAQGHGQRPWPVRHLEAAGSTQDIAIAAACAGEPGPLVILADRQTAGRGRAGRAWEAPAGNLNFSAMLRPGAIKLQPAAWSLLAGVAVHEAVAAHLPKAAGLMLKWPNDLLLHGAKLAGVLIDSALTPAGLIDWVVIGIGVNIAHAPHVPGRATACLADAGATVTPTALAATLVAQLITWDNAGPAATRAAWLARAHPPGTALRVQNGAELLEGTFAGLAEDGSLKLENQRAIASGDVFLTGPGEGA